MTRHYFRGGWAYALDYDAEIAQDKADIDLYANGGRCDLVWAAFQRCGGVANAARNALDAMEAAALVSLAALHDVASAAGVAHDDALLVVWQSSFDADDRQAAMARLDAALEVGVEALLLARIAAGEIVEPGGDTLSLYGYASRAAKRVWPVLERIPLYSPEQRKFALSRARASLRRHEKRGAR